MPNRQLSWQPGFSLSRKPTRRPTVRRTKQGASGNADRPQQFEFIAEHSLRNKVARHPLSVNTGPNSGDPIELVTRCQATSDPNGNSLLLINYSNNKHSLISDEHGAYAQGEAIKDTEPPGETPLRASSDKSLIETRESPDSKTIYETAELSPYPCNNEGRYALLHLLGSVVEGQLQIFEGSDIDQAAFHEKSRQIAATEPEPMTVSDLSNMTCYPYASIPDSVLYSSLSQRFRPVLDRYNGEFCKIPLTSDLQINPFRCRADLNPEPIFLVHAVMALAGHHIDSPSTQNHRQAALQLLRQSLNPYNIGEAGYLMLDTITILFSLDETQSAFGNWRTHLVGAYGILEACGGIKGWATSARAEVQVGMLTWWDATTSLLSREDCVFPYAYFEAVLSNHSGREWDFFGLCGCPPSLVKVVMQLARLSAEKQKSSSMRYVTFDTTVISEIQQSLESWHHVSPATAFRDEECMQQDQDSMHCSEAWRNGLLLYIYRVFQWEPGNSIPMHILYHARVTVDHVFACRDEMMVSRQALLPLFFAGCELRDRSSRKKIVKFCSDWNERTRYHVFMSAIPLLEEVWAEQEEKGFENVWWGQVVDKQHLSDSHYPLQMRICFG